MYVDHIQASAPPLAGRTPPPDTHLFLFRALSSLEDDSNKYAPIAFVFLWRVANVYPVRMAGIGPCE